MMHGREKSSPVIVAGKPANKAQPETVTAAESVERRTGAKGNANQPATIRTQGRAHVAASGLTLALASIRQAAKLDRLYPRWEPYAGKPHVRVWCSEASCHSSGCESRQQRSPVTVVVIPSNGEGNRAVGSLEVQAPGGRAYRSDPYRGASNLAGRSKCVNQEAPKDVPRAKRIAGRMGVPSRSDLGEGNVGVDVLDQTMTELPGVIEGGMPRRNGQRKPGTTRGSPRRSRTAKALRISRHAVKSQCAHGWGGWGRLSDDGSRQHNSDPSEDPWGGGLPHLHGGVRSSGRPDTEREYRTATKRAKGRHKLHISPRMPGAGLSGWSVGRCCPTCRPSSRIGENPPCGMIGRVEETSASFEALSAPRLYPTAEGVL
jgi:hypothetical protein